MESRAKIHLSAPVILKLRFIIPVVVEAGTSGRIHWSRWNPLSPFIDRVTNPQAAAGGADMETLEEAKLRTPWEIKHRNRAVTAEDFERFAVDATGQVAKAHCRPGDDGVVKLLIIPKDSDQNSAKLEASIELCDRVKEFIDMHRLITTRVNVMGPVYTNISIRTRVTLMPRMAYMGQQIRQEIEEYIRGFFHPLNGGLYNQGWSIGRSVNATEIFFILENVKGVDAVEFLILNDSPMVNKIQVDPFGFPYLDSISIEFTGG